VERILVIEIQIKHKQIWRTIYIKGKTESIQLKRKIQNNNKKE
jgi:hypothetical protein